MPTRSSGVFSIGVPVRAQLRVRRIERAISLVVLLGVLDPLGFVEHHQVEMQPFVEHVAVAHQQLVVGDLDRARRPAVHCQRRLAASPSMIVSGISGAHRLNSRCQLVTSGLGQMSSTLRSSPERSSMRIAVIACIVLPRPISSASTADVARVEKRDALILIRERLEGEVQGVGLNQRFQRRLQDVVQPVFELDDVAGRLDAGEAAGSGSRGSGVGTARRRGASGRGGEGERGR